METIVPRLFGVPRDIHFGERPYFLTSEIITVKKQTQERFTNGHWTLTFIITEIIQGHKRNINLLL